MPIGFSRRRFRRGGSRFRAFREPRTWVRGINAIASVNGALNAAGVFVPNTLNLTTVDTRLTLRRMILDTVAIESVASAAANVQLVCGVAMFDIGAPNPDPDMLVARDTETDWLDLFQINPRVSAGRSLSWDSYTGHIRDIRAMRKVDNTQQIAVTLKAKNADTGVALADGTYRLRWSFSVLFSRTSR